MLSFRPASISDLTQRNLILHVGMPKCGTSSVQKVFAENREALRSAGLDYLSLPAADLPDPRHKSTGNANSLIYAMFGYKEEHLAMTVVLAQLRAAIESSTCETVILSHEDFIIFGPEHLEKLKQGLAPFVGQIIPIIHIRDHVSWLASDYQQHIKQLRSSRSIGEHVGRRLRVLSFSGQCAKFRAVFGTVVCRLVLPGMNIAHDFASTLGYDVPALEKSANTENAGLTAAAVKNLLKINRQGFSDADYRRAYADAIGSATGERFSLPDDVANVVRAYVEPDVSALRAFLSNEEWNRLQSA